MEDKTERYRQIERAYAAVNERIRRALDKRGGSGDVTLLAATKTVPADEIEFAIRELGLSFVRGEPGPGTGGQV